MTFKNACMTIYRENLHQSGLTETRELSGNIEKVLGQKESVRKRYASEGFGGVFMLSQCFLDFFCG